MYEMGIVIIGSICIVYLLIIGIIWPLLNYKFMKNKNFYSTPVFNSLEELREAIAENCDGPCTIFETPDFVEAVIGISDDNRVIYDYELMVHSLMKNDDMTEEEAIEFIDYNTMRTLPYMENHPIIKHDII